MGSPLPKPKRSSKEPQHRACGHEFFVKVKLYCVVEYQDGWNNGKAKRDDSKNGCKQFHSPRDKFCVERLY